MKGTSDSAEDQTNPITTGLRRVWRLVRSLSRLLATCRLRDLAAARYDRSAFERRIAAGDIIVCVGAAWLNPAYGDALARAKRRYGIRFVTLIHDIIPISAEHLVPVGATARFCQWLAGVTAASDCLLTQSEHCHGELVTYGRQQGWRLPPIEPVRFGSGFRALSASRTTSLPEFPPGSVLVVSTLEIRKNHKLLVKVWRRLLLRYDGERVPNLVFVGRFGWMVEDLMAELAASNRLNGKIVILPELSDDRVGEAYRRCLFTIFPSLCEGWGLPVAESLAYGKLCVASNRTSIPEVGGDLADYFDPDDEDDALAKIERVLFEPGYLAAREARVRADYHPPSWADCMNSLMATLDALPLQPPPSPA